MDLQRVAQRLAVDQGYRQRAAEGLHAAGGGGDDALGRVRRLRDYLATGKGLAILDDEHPAAPSGPLPWEQQQPSLQQQQQHQQHQQPPALDVSPEDSDIEEEPEQPSAEAMAALLAEAQAAVERRRAAAAVAIQCAFRRHTAQALLRQLRERHLVTDRLAARVMAAAYKGACGTTRSLARQATLRQLRRLHRWRLRRRQRLYRQLEQGKGGSAEVEEQQQQQQQQHPQSAPAEPPASATAAEPVQQGGADAAAQSWPSQACNAPRADEPPVAPGPVGGRRAGTPLTVLIAAPGPPPPGFLPHSGLDTSASSGSSRQGSPAAQQPWQQRQASPLARVSLGSGGAASTHQPASPLQQGASPPRTAAGASGSACQPLYQCSSSIQLLEAVQLGIDGGSGSVASHAALGVCERVQQRVQDLQRTASQGRPGTAGGGAAGPRISRVGSSKIARQASSRAWGGEAILE